MIRNPFEILTEAVRSEAFEVEDLNGCEDNDLDDSLVQGQFNDIYDDTEELEDDIEYTEEMVAVIQNESADGTRYLVEMDVLAKYMESANITDVSEAITNIAEHNDLDADTMCVVIESDDYAQQMLTEAKKSKKDPTNTKTKGIKSSLDVINLMKTKGIKVVKKRSKSKSKKKK